jgi:hypothetical protein
MSHSLVRSHGQQSRQRAWDLRMVLDKGLQRGESGVQVHCAVWAAKCQKCYSPLCTKMHGLGRACYAPTCRRRRTTSPRKKKVDDRNPGYLPARDRCPPVKIPTVPLLLLCAHSRIASTCRMSSQGSMHSTRTCPLSISLAHRQLVPPASPPPATAL